MKLYIHIGHGKTGTSAIQAALAIHADRLKEAGILYPISQGARDAAAQLKVTSGNIPHNNPALAIPRMVSACHEEARAHAIVLSNEGLFWTIDGFLENSSMTCRNIEVLLVLAVRNLDQMVSSEYQQFVKRGGESRSYEEFLRGRQYVSSHHERAARLLEIVTKLGINIKVLNYSKLKSSIVTEFFRLIGADSSLVHESARVGKVNRSLTSSELDALILINSLYSRRYPEISRIISDELVHRLPDIPTHALALSEAEKTALYEVNKGYVSAINSFLQPADHISCFSAVSAESDASECPTADLEIEGESRSLALIADVLTGFISKKNLPPLSQDAVQAIIESAGSATLSDSIKIELLQLALLYRPNGVLLRRRLDSLLK